MALAYGCVVSGGDGGDRTPDLHVANVALSQLSYIPTGKNLESEIYT